ncbi:MAG: hypothetical protein Q8T11_14685 [Elusimicrobiota bacterium]|nr:hypothetical protein [Elusimicrobiota bacterium]
MMIPKNILVLDDETLLVNQWARKLKKLKLSKKLFSDVVPVDSAQFANELGILRHRQELFRAGKPWKNKSIFDNASVLLVDYDLVGILGEKLYITGEEVSYLVRCFSTCGYIVGLNFEPGNRFDLTLRDHPDSFADLHIPTVQLANSALWGLGSSEFHPWTWPSLSDHWTSFERQVQDAEANLDKPICDFLGFPRDVVDSFSRSVAEFLLEDVHSVTFRKVAFLNGLRGKDEKARKAPPEVIARIAAARVSKWLESLVLQGQDILVDAPHLVWRYPSLLTKPANRLKSWDLLAARTSNLSSLGIKHSSVEAHRFTKSHWLSRPAWFWKGISNNSAIPEVAEPWKTTLPSFVFAEDRSRFVDKSKSKEFISETDSPYARRYVSPVGDVIYAPHARYAS